MKDTQPNQFTTREKSQPFKPSTIYCCLSLPLPLSLSRSHTLVLKASWISSCLLARRYRPSSCGVANVVVWPWWIINFVCRPSEMSRPPVHNVIWLRAFGVIYLDRPTQPHTGTHTAVDQPIHSHLLFTTLPVAR
jgi:hypothetical protein